MIDNIEDHSLFSGLADFSARHPVIPGIDYIENTNYRMNKKDREMISASMLAYYIENPLAGKRHSKKMKKAWKRGLFTEERNKKIAKARTGNPHPRDCFLKGWETRRKKNGPKT